MRCSSRFKSINSNLTIWKKCFTKLGLVPESPERKSQGAETGIVRLSVQAPVANSGCTFGARKRTIINSAQKLSGSFPFSPKIPNFDLPTPKYVYKDRLQVHELKRAFKNTLNMKTNVISTWFTKSTHFHKNHQQQLNSHHKLMIMNTQVMNHQKQYLMTTTTSIKHEFHHKSTTT